MAGRFAGLIVPRADGFWRVAMVRTCSDSAGTDAVGCSDGIWARPLAETPPPGDRSPEPDPCTYDYQAVNFVSPALLAVREQHGNSDRCEPRGWRWREQAWVQTYESDTNVAFGKLGPGASASYRVAVTHAPNVGSEQTPSPPQDDACRADPEDEEGWTVVRERAAWVAHAFQQQGDALCQLEGSIAWPLPAKVLGFPEPQVNWAAVTAVVPDVEQAFASPRRDLLLVVVPSAFRLYALSDDKPGTVLLELPRTRTPAVREDIVMVQWAQGRSVAAWTRVLAGVR